MLFKRIHLAGIARKRWPILWTQAAPEPREAERARQVEGEVLRGTAWHRGARSSRPRRPRRRVRWVSKHQPRYALVSAMLSKGTAER
jgi:hypothetical protein